MVLLRYILSKVYAALHGILDPFHLKIHHAKFQLERVRSGRVNLVQTFAPVIVVVLVGPSHRLKLAKVWPERRINYCRPVQCGTLNLSSMWRYCTSRKKVQGKI